MRKLIDNWFGKGRELRQQADELYVALVAQARTPWLYADLGVPDTVDGRFDLIALHVWAAHKTLVARPMPAPVLAQRLVDTMFTDMDRGLRELGVGDHGVSHRLKKMVGAFHGRVVAYNEAADAEALAAALSRNVYRSAEPVQRALPLARYVLDLAGRYAAAPYEELAAARLPAAPQAEEVGA